LKTINFEALFSASPNPYVLLDLSLTIVEMNDAYLQVTMRKREDLLGRNMFEAFPSDPDSTSYRQLRGSLEKVIREKTADDLPLIEYAIPLPNGQGFEERYWSATHTPLFNHNGEMAFVLQHTVDVTELHRLRNLAKSTVLSSGPSALIETDMLRRAQAVQEANQALSEERQHLRGLFQQAPGFMAALSGPAHVFTMANTAYLQLVGRENILGKPVREALPEVVGQGFIELLDRVYQGGQPFVGRSIRILLKQGPESVQEERFLDFVYQPIFDPDGQVSGIFVQGHDVTDARQAEQALRDETRNLAILNRTGASIAAELDLDRVVQMVTDAGVALAGAQFGAFFYNVLDEKGESYMLYALSGVEREAFANFAMPRATAVFQPTFQGDGIIRSDNILQDPRYGHSEPHRGMPKGHLPVRSYLAVPVISRSGEVLGGLFFGHAEIGMFKQEHEVLLAGIAGQAAVAIDNARLFQSARRELEERRRVEIALRESEERFRAIANSIDQLIWATQADGYHDYYNQRWYEYTGVPEGTTDGEAWNGMFHPDDQEHAWSVWRHCLATGEPYHIEYRLRHRSGEYRWVLGRAQPVRDEDGRIKRWFGTCTDIHDFKQAQDALRASRERALRTEEETRRLASILAERVKELDAANEEIQRFAYIVSHDLRAPLVNVMGFTSELEGAQAEIERFYRNVQQADPNLIAPDAKAAIEADLPEAIGFIRSSTVKMDKLILAILKLSREGRRVLAPEPIDMVQLLETQRGSVAHQLHERGAELLIEPVPDLTSDRLAIEQIFGNLIDNAVKYLHSSRAGRIVVRGRNLADNVLYEVEDNGRGIDPKDFERIFDLFRRSGAQDQQGEGIGLAHVRALVRRLGGTISVSSRVGEGSTFTVILPKYISMNSEAA
jgi:PAS domain S-box-containing protein